PNGAVHGHCSYTSTFLSTSHPSGRLHARLLLCWCFCLHESHATPESGGDMLFNGLLTELHRLCDFPLGVAIYFPQHERPSALHGKIPHGTAEQGEFFLRGDTIQGLVGQHADLT